MGLVSEVAFRELLSAVVMKAEAEVVMKAEAEVEAETWTWSI
jgi:hypothetical protein